jgi:hypothetical protein
LLAAVVLTVMTAGPWPTARSDAAETLTCTWGGTPSSPTGEFTIDPGTTLSPSAGPLDFFATGVLDSEDGCNGRFTMRGIIHAGSHCLDAPFSGKARGIPVVDTFEGNIPFTTAIPSSLLYDRAGNLVGRQQMQIVTQDDEHSEPADCNTEEGFTHGLFSAVVVVSDL